MSDRLPEQCKPNCPFLKRDDLDRYPVVFSRNCKGPVIGDERGIGKTVLMSAEGIQDVKPGQGNSVGILFVGMLAQISRLMHWKKFFNQRKKN